MGELIDDRKVALENRHEERWFCSFTLNLQTVTNETGTRFEQDRRVPIAPAIITRHRLTIRDNVRYSGR